MMRAQTRVGTVLRKWKLDALLGIGGMASVYAATHRNESRVAIKILHPELSLHAEIRARFFREGRVANVVGHPGVVRVIDDDVADDGAAFLVMDLLDGETLDARAQRLGGKLPVEEVLAVADHVLDVLVAAHEKGIIHRDLKPENIFLERDGRVRVLDFGIARLRELSASSSTATKAGTTLGTPAFMAPEQGRALWDQVDGRSDLWAVGACMFALLAGKPVHEGRSSNELLLSAMTRAAPPVRSLAPEVPSAVAEVVDRALEFARDERWPDARAMQHEVRRAYERLHESPLSTAPKLLVPENVPNKTLPSADLSSVPRAAAGTSVPVVNGITGASILRTISRHPTIAAASAAGVGLVVVVVVVVTLALRGQDGAENQTTSAAAEPTLRRAAPLRLPSPPPATPPARASAGLAPAARSDVVALDDLPTSSPKTRPVAAPTMAKTAAKPAAAPTPSAATAKRRPPAPNPYVPQPGKVDNRKW